MNLTGFSDLFRNKEGYLFSNKALLFLFLPLIGEKLLEMLVGFADSIMVASLGEAAISGVSLVDFVMQLLIFSFAALAAGGAVIAGQYIGDRKLDMACKSVDQLLWFNAIFSFVLMMAILIFRSTIIGLLFGSIEADVWANADKYLVIAAFSIPFMAIFNVGGAIFRTTGNSYLPMKVLLVCDVLNIIGNAYCIYFLGMDVTGVAIPTVLSRFLSAAIIIFFALNPKYELHLTRSLRFRFNWRMLKNILGVGIPYGVENGLFQLGRILILSLVSTFGTMAIAANSVGYALTVFQVLPGFAINLGLTVVISQCVGAKDFEQAKYYNKKILIIIFASITTASLVVYAALPQILGIYGLSTQTAELTAEMILWHTVFSIIIWPIAFSLPSTFRGAGDAKFPMYVGIIVMFSCRIGLSYVLSLNYGMGVIGTWFAMFIDWFVRAGVYVYRYFSGKWMEFRAIE
ncbi:MAG: MATE family efflux transporter [Methanobrevibacter sp.]|uniref:MATE family efflux transporter n=1 Tax=Methanobrevibacter sp. TaxID=66852 RepID=UPI0026DFEB04|nr:MATE family efflux transporter [Methanobrevibacter sp.]MDO5849180.1 MATE family efflux transporter [Methanobrevibacter sp.]